MERIPGEITRVLADPNLQRKDALDQVLPLIYRDLRRLAGSYLKKERTGHTLQPTALVHEAYLRLIKQSRGQLRNRSQFLGIAGQMMRRILVDYARARAVRKLPGTTALPGEAGSEAGGRVEEILAVDEALNRLAKFDARQVRVVELRYFAGMSVDETATVLSVSPRTVKREFAIASAWLRGELNRKAQDESGSLGSH